MSFSCIVTKYCSLVIIITHHHNGNYIYLLFAIQCKQHFILLCQLKTHTIMIIKFEEYHSVVTICIYKEFVLHFYAFVFGIVSIVNCFHFLWKIGNFSHCLNIFEETSDEFYSNLMRVRVESFAFCIELMNSH